MRTQPDDPILTIQEAAAYLRMPVNTLRFYRHQRIGPRSFKLGRRVSYRQSDLDAWLEAQAAAGVGAEL